MQNGLGGEQLVADLVGAERLLGGIAYLCSNKIGPGHIRHLDYGQVMLGEYSPSGVTERVQRVAADFEAAGIKATCLDDLRVGRWQKLVWNIPYNALSVLHNATTAELMSREETRHAIREIMDEVVAAARVNGVVLPSDIVNSMLERTTRMKPYRTSMKLDHDNGRPMEIEAIIGNPLRAALAAGCRVPRIEALYHQLKDLETQAT